MSRKYASGQEHWQLNNLIITFFLGLLSSSYSLIKKDSEVQSVGNRPRETKSSATSNSGRRRWSKKSALHRWVNPVYHIWTEKKTTNPNCQFNAQSRAYAYDVTVTMLVLCKYRLLFWLKKTWRLITWANKLHQRIDFPFSPSVRVVIYPLSSNIQPLDWAQSTRNETVKGWSFFCLLYSCSCRWSGQTNRLVSRLNTGKNRTCLHFTARHRLISAGNSGRAWEI